MKLFVIGATGRTGLEIVQQALARGYHVTAFVRSPENITLRNERLTVVKGNAMDENQLFNAMQSHDAVLSTLGPRKVFKPSSLLRDSALATDSRNEAFGSETARRSLSRSAFSRYSQSNRQLHHAKPHARFACHGRSRAGQRSRLDNRSASASHSGRLHDLSKPGGRCSQDGFHCFSQSGRGIYARRHRAKETLPQNRRHREITIGRGRADVAYLLNSFHRPSDKRFF